jgi:Spx/MgsR family transcriptional regulator
VYSTSPTSGHRRERSARPLCLRVTQSLAERLTLEHDVRTKATHLTRKGEARVAETEIYLYSSCTSCRKAEDFLSELGIDTERRDYFKQRFNRDELVQLLERIGKRPGDVLSTRSTPYRTLDLASKELTDDELIDLTIEHPQLLRRPLIVRGSQSTVGFNRDAISALVKGDS